MILRVEGVRKLCEELTLLVVQLRGYHHPNDDNLVATTVLAQKRHTLAPQLKGLPGLCTGWDAQLLSAVEGRHLQIFAEGGLGHI